MTRITDEEHAALKARGVRIIGTCTIPDFKLREPFSSGETGYEVQDRGSRRVLTLRQMQDAARR